jgi:hypothetical protein
LQTNEFNSQAFEEGMRKRSESATNELIIPEKALYTQLAHHVQESCFQKFIVPFFKLNEAESEHNSNQIKSANIQKTPKAHVNDETFDTSEIKEKAPLNSQRVIELSFFLNQKEQNY